MLWAFPGINFAQGQEKKRIFEGYHKYESQQNTLYLNLKLDVFKKRRERALTSLKVILSKKRRKDF